MVPRFHWMSHSPMLTLITLGAGGSFMPLKRLMRLNHHSLPTTHQYPQSSQHLSYIHRHSLQITCYRKLIAIAVDNSRLTLPLSHYRYNLSPYTSTRCIVPIHKHCPRGVGHQGGERV